MSISMGNAAALICFNLINSLVCVSQPQGVFRTTRTTAKAAVKTLSCAATLRETAVHLVLLFPVRGLICSCYIVAPVSLLSQNNIVACEY